MEKTALVTGGGRGIGLGISRALTAEGWNLAVCGIKPEDKVDSIEELKASGVKFEYIQADISLGEDRAALIKEVTARFGGINLLVNNAGVAPLQRKDILEADEESFDRVMNINLKGPYFLTRMAASFMIEQKKRDPGSDCRIVFIGSVSSTLASVGRGEYCISKAGISMAAQLWAVRLGEFDIPVYEIRPGIILTDMTSGVKAKYDSQIENGLLVQPRWGSPSDIGKAVASVARGDFNYSTGQVFTVDGGMTLGIL